MFISFRRQFIFCCDICLLKQCFMTFWQSDFCPYYFCTLALKIISVPGMQLWLKITLLRNQRFFGTMMLIFTRWCYKSTSYDQIFFFFTENSYCDISTHFNLWEPRNSHWFLIPQVHGDIILWIYLCDVMNQYCTCVSIFFFSRM